MKPRRLIEAEGSAAGELRAIVQQIIADELARVAEPRFSAIEDRQDRGDVVFFRLNERVSVLEGPDAKPEIVGQTVKGFAKRVHRSPETVRKYIRQGRLPVERLGVHPIIAADATLPPRRRKSTI